MSQTEINTELAQKLEDIFKEGSQRKFKAAPPRKKRSSKKKNASTDNQHLSSTATPKAILTKNSVYRENGSDYLRAQNGRGVYRNFSHNHLNDIRDLVCKVAEFPGGPPQNFDRRSKDSSNKGAGAKWPYPWEAHHILPEKAFTYVKTGGAQQGKPVFTEEQRGVLLRTEYDLNHGHNIIMLPDQNWAVPIHMLLQHPSNHPVYNDSVIGRMGDIAKEFQKVVDEQKDHQTPEEVMFDFLKDLEDEFWSYLIKLSASVVSAVIEGQEFTSANVRFAKDDGTPYKWGALY